MAEVELSDIISWLRVERPHSDLGKLDWGVAPLRNVATAERDLVSFAADHILASEETLSKFLRAIGELRSLAELSVSANVAVYFDHDAMTRNFVLPSEFMRTVGRAVDEIEISVYSTDAEKS